MGSAPASTERARAVLTAPALPELPAGYRLERGARGVCAVADWARAALAEAGFGADGDGALVASDLAGRRALEQVAGTDLLVRRYAHGGLLRFATGRRYADPSRPFRELCHAAWLAERGVATPPVAAARARRVGPVGWELTLVTRRVAGASDLWHALDAVRRGTLPRARARELAGALGALVARLHAVGFLHADLTPRNVLSAPAGLLLIDLDLARVVERPGDGERRDNLRRLWRFVDRRAARDGAVLARTDLARFWRAYQADRARRHADWRAVAAAHARHKGWHAAGWLLERLFGR